MGCRGRGGADRAQRVTTVQRSYPRERAREPNTYAHTVALDAEYVTATKCHWSASAVARKRLLPAPPYTLPITGRRGGGGDRNQHNTP
jgi:hypothetical protein